MEKRDSNFFVLKKTTVQSVVFSIISWLGLGDGNITFSDELDFDPAELNSVYEDDNSEKQ